jgi:DeoR/GlpR family transcriptional regulator of sugar metabolism
MLAAQRRQAIRRMLAERPTTRIVELAAELHVSRDTVRSDLRFLAHDVAPAGPRHHHDPYAPAKVNVAAAAARLVRPGQTIALTAGTTTRALARAVAQIPGVIIVTNSLPAARLLGAVAPSVELASTAGAVSPPSISARPNCTANGSSTPETSRSSPTTASGAPAPCPPSCRWTRSACW